MFVNLRIKLNLTLLNVTKFFILPIQEFELPSDKKLSYTLQIYHVIIISISMDIIRIHTVRMNKLRNYSFNGLKIENMTFS